MIPNSSFCFLYCTVLVDVWFGLHFRIHVFCLIVQCVCWGWFICFDVSFVFAMSYSYRSSSSANELLQLLHFNLYMPLEFILFSGIQSQNWLYMVVLVRKAIFKLVFKNKLVTQCMSGLWYVKVTHFFCCVCVGVTSDFHVSSINKFFSLWINCNGKPLFLAAVRTVFHHPHLDKNNGYPLQVIHKLKI